MPRRNVARTNIYTKINNFKFTLYVQSTNRKFNVFTLFDTIVIALLMLIVINILSLNGK